jgi:hypothetical protein
MMRGIVDFKKEIIMKNKVIFISLFIVAFAVACFMSGGTTRIMGRVLVTSSDTSPTCAVATGDGDACAADAVESEGAVDVGTTLTTGTSATIGTSLAVTTSATVGTTLGVTGAITGLRKVDTKTATYTVDATTDCGMVILDATDNAVITVPDAATANAGCCVTVIATAADGGALISVSPHSSDGIDGSCMGITPVFYEFSGAVNKDLQLTKSTSNKGDTVTLCSDGSAGWYVTNCLGIWVSQS